MAVYNFFVGDPILLVGTLLTFVIVGLGAHAATSDGARFGLGIVLAAGVILSLALSLYRETQPKRK
jgi:hypothetical protein